MTDDFHKFIFLGAMIVLAVFSNRDSLYRQKAVVADAKQFAQNQTSPLAVSRVEPPMFVLNPPKKQATAPAYLGEPRAAVSEDAFPPLAEEKKSSSVLQSSPDAPVTSFKKVGNEDPSNVGANVVLVADLASGDEFFSKGPEKRWPIASITKLMSAAVVSKELAFHQSTTLLEADFPLESPGKNLKIEDRYSVADLMLAMLLESSNESAEALARMYGRENFLSAMNQTAALWGIPGTHFSDPTGLSPSNQSTSADLRKLALTIYGEYPEIFKITKKASARITELNFGKRLSLTNINLLASRADFLGGKTGYIDEAGGNLLSIFSYARRPIIIIVLGSDDRFGETEKLLTWFEKNYR
ncbi:MAG: D-alanyl-D-alanine carboxypeptidase [Candidatus Liptonbacteria bacterium]|nr:D-alanyl-D-alanine carboxypeptidase [Candidatus Liptonbacteria bacterium]